MQLYEIIFYSLCFSGIVIGGIALLIYWLMFKKEYYDALARYKRFIEKSSIEELNSLYNREFPADYSIKEIQEFMKGDRDDSNQVGD